ncbi:MAG: 2-aminoethylphosphonate--pyruvate transaminase [Calditerrivibrio sp.]|nr:2-aminoethylphosphonate--pyruvate transaminase [Calditerrivibrio sp.]MCA1931986.1 2-aminoethylphosphonate--pyruvate transaminase [Calditerrivibrio sp.]MCA1980176.1 2-aminoethylphosphonate--pyruvate transaminase [Calditerrivibrio sp.]
MDKDKILLFTPGPLTTSETVKKSMLEDMPTRDIEYANLVQSIRRDLLYLSGSKPEDYATILIQGSGTYAVEAVIGSIKSIKNAKLLILINGTYGRRIAEIAKIVGIKFVKIEFKENKPINVAHIEKYLRKNKDITHVASVHLETTTGILNPIEDIGNVTKRYKKYFIVDAMSSFCGVPLDFHACNADFIISSANKCIQGVPGVAFVIGKIKTLKKHSHSHSLSLNLYEQWRYMEKNNGSFRYTSPTHVMRALRKAIDELNEEGGIPLRYKRYRENMDLLISEMENIGFISYIKKDHQSPVIATFILPKSIEFKDLYESLKNEGFVIYPGKLTKIDTFRIGVIGEIYREDINNLIDHISKYIKK